MDEDIQKISKSFQSCENCSSDKDDFYNSRFEVDTMTGSYSEIYNSNPAMLDLNLRKLSDEITATSSKDSKQFSTKPKLAKRPMSLTCDDSFPYNLEGTVSKEGDLTNFVAEDLEYKIKLSSPVVKKDIYSTSFSSCNSTPSIIRKQFLNSQQIPQIDSNVLNDIEIEAQYLAASVDNLTENLCNLLHSISSITADNVEIHKNTINKLTDGMDANIKCMYTIMAKTEEISKSMEPIERLSNRMREIKRLVDMLENTL